MFDAFFIIGVVLFIGFITSRIFERTKFPDVILLMLVGLLLGPILKIVSIEGTISSLAPYIGTLALIIILFEGGLHLNIFKVFTVLVKATGFTFLVFSLNMVFLGISMKFIFGWTYLEGLLLGAVIGGTSSAIVIPIISRLSMSEESRIILSLESILTDALCVIAAIALIGIINIGTVDLRAAASSIAGAFSIAAVIGAIFAAFWIEIINKLKQVEYSLTMAVVFILYSTVEVVRGNGAIAVFVFSLLLSNYSELAAAVLATIPLAAGIRIPYFAEIVFSIIILTNLATTIGVFIIHHKRLKGLLPTEFRNILCV